MNRKGIPRCISVVLLGSLLNQACVSTVPYQRPVLSIPAHWTGAVPVNAQPIILLDKDWWHEFADPSLQQLIVQVTQHNLDLRVAIDRMRMAQDNLRRTQALRYPKLMIGGYPTDPLSSQLAVADSAGRRQDIDTNLFEFSLNASYIVDLWGQVSNTITAARASHQASIFDVRAVAIAVRSVTARIYFDVRQLDEEYMLAQQQQELARKRLELMQLRQAAGRVGAKFVTMAQLDQLDIQDRLTNLSAERTLAVQSLALLLGRNPEELTLPALPLRASIRIPTPPEGLPSSLLTRRPDLRAAEAQLQAAHAQVEISRAELLPQVSLTAQYGFVTGAVHGLLHSGSTIMGIGPIINYPLFSGGLLKAQVDASHRYQDVALATYQKAVFNAFADVEKALLGYQIATESSTRWSVASAAQQAVLQRTELVQHAGMSSRVEEIVEQEKLLELELRQLHAYRARLESLITLYQALGGGWNFDILAN